MDAVGISVKHKLLVILAISVKHKQLLITKCFNAFFNTGTT